MNILVISKITNNKSSGMSVIIPKHIKYLSEISDVTWINLNDTINEDLNLNAKIITTSTQSIKSIYKINFEIYNIIIFHGIYYSEYISIGKILVKQNLPYIIVPHGSFTKTAMKKKWLKKTIAMSLFFKKFVYNAQAIQFLSKGEMNSSLKLNNNSFIVPNGIEPISFDYDIKMKEVPSKKAIYIGRKDIYLKGIDNLIFGIKQIKSLLISKNFVLEIHGPKSKKSDKYLKKIIQKEKLESIISVKDAIYNNEKLIKLVSSDLFILTSRSEGHPVAVLEALSCSLPCLVTKETNMGAEISRLRAGFVCEINSPKCIANKLKEFVCMDKKLYYEMRSNAFELSKDYHWRNIAKIALKQYEKLGWKK